jgi:DNA-binding GntR family transcriptional regulator
MPAVYAPTKQMIVHRALREEILGGALAPGQPLVIDAIARRFGVSIIPVREALRQLQAERLVEVRAHTGARVAAVDASALEEIFSLLAALEGATMAAAAARWDAGAERRMAGILERLREAEGDAAAFEEANRDFHLLPCEVAGMPRALEMMRGLMGEWERLHRQAFAGAPPPAAGRANRQHRAMARAMREGAADEARVLAELHNRQAAEHYRRHRDGER